ncbi:probable L-ascorbate peroxidase 6, chloroplastic/mitochondrial isoform X1 [Papaver somniferum]|uniref:probable L-ascorbate peroxidase 6, chloroplastic/mitochondrial isoform X1 n=1 Tax=Papaver somniferum TaxID=3469 RepID=UPI000E6F68F0|nr:probable L-ascorbate peroxidase 6, chloroplastic/mitochondrial isoform X1 [Papaver somniferum]
MAAEQIVLSSTMSCLTTPASSSPSRLPPFSSSTKSRVSLLSTSSPSSSVTSLRSSTFYSSPLPSLSIHHQRRSSLTHVTKTGAAVVNPTCFASDPDQLKSAREDIKQLLKTTFCHPIMIRLGWHDAGTYNKDVQEFPQRGGANGSLRFDVELKHGANAGLVNALKLLQPIKEKYPGVTYADLFQLASATAIEDAGGPKIPMKYGRVDVSVPDECPEEGRLPDAGPPSPADHLRKVFYRMGLNDKEIVALSGAHTLGRSRPERSGWGKPETKYTKDGPGAPGGQSWTAEWLKFDNSYFKDIKEKRDEDLLVLPTDAALFDDPSFKVYAEKYATNQEEFFKDYAEAHAKLSNQGAQFNPPEGFSIEDGSPNPKAEKFVASKYSSGKRELSDSMKQKIRAEYEGFGGSPDKPLKTNYFLNIIIIISVLAILTSLLGN